MPRFNRRKLCECGCGQTVNPGKRFISGHNTRLFTLDQRVQMGAAIKKRYDEDPMYKQRQRNSHTGIKQSSLARQNMSKSRIGMQFSEQHLQNLSASIKQSFLRPAVQEKRVLAQKKLWQDPEYRERMLKAIYKGQGRKPTSIEVKIENLLNVLFPGEWKYTGDFSFIINGKNPDFVNVNGQKKLIEVFGNYWHRGEDPQDRINVFSPFGWETLVIWEKEISLENEPFLIKKLQEFHKQETKIGARQWQNTTSR